MKTVNDLIGWVNGVPDSIDWQARCLKAEERQAIEENLRDKVERSAITAREELFALQAELAAIKGRQEWGTQSVFGTSARESESDAEQVVAQYPTRLRLVSRYSAGPWVPVKEGQG